MSAKVTLGPVIGEVSKNTAIILVEVNQRIQLTVRLNPENSEKESKKFSKRAVVPANRPKAFSFKKLPPGTKFQVSITSPDLDASTVISSSFTTFPKDKNAPLRVCALSCDRPERVLEGEENPWIPLSKKVLAGEYDLMLHLGDQVYINKAFDDAWLIYKQWEQNPGEATERQALAAVRERFRDVYRKTWNQPGLKEVLANVPHLMIWSDNDIYNDFTLGTVGNIVLPPKILKTGHDVYREYQRQLWNPFKEQKDQEKSTAEYHFRAIGRTGILLLDMRSHRFDINGNAIPENPILSPEQWEFVNKSIDNNKLKALIVCAEIPFVGDSPADAKPKALDPNTEFIKDHWSYNHTELERILETLFQWKQSGTGRDVLLIGGDIHVGVESRIKDAQTNQEILQITTSPITNHVCEFFPKLSGSINERFSFEHFAVTKSRNWADIKITFPSEAASLEFFLHNAGAPTQVEVRHSSASKLKHYEKMKARLEQNNLISSQDKIETDEKFQNKHSHKIELNKPVKSIPKIDFSAYQEQADEDDKGSESETSDVDD